MVERLGYDKVLHMLRNPHGFKEAELRAARLEAADRLEGLQDAYLNMRAWAEQNGLNTMARGNAGCTPAMQAAHGVKGLEVSSREDDRG